MRPMVSFRITIMIMKRGKKTKSRSDTSYLKRLSQGMKSLAIIIMDHQVCWRALTFSSKLSLSTPSSRRWSD